MAWLLPMSFRGLEIQKRPFQPFFVPTTIIHDRGFNVKAIKITHLSLAVTLALTGVNQVSALEAEDSNVMQTADKTDGKQQPQTSSGAVKLSDITVTGKADEKSKTYTTLNSSTATKTDTPIFDTPVSVQVVPRAVMDDQKTTRIKDALENVSGVRAQPTLGGDNGFIIRGFRNSRVYRNGLLANADGFPTEVDAGNLQSIDVLKGPAAVLFGRIEPGRRPDQYHYQETAGHPLLFPRATVWLL